MKRKISLFVLMIFFVISYSCQCMSKEKFHVGVNQFYPPFTLSSQSGYIQGSDIEVMLAVCSRLNLDCIFIQMPLDKLASSLNNNQVDAVIGGLAVTPDRKMLYTFTKPYLKTTLSLVANRKSEIVNTPTSLANRRVGVLKDSINFAYAYRHFSNAKITNYDTAEQLISALINNKVDVVLLDTPAAEYWVTYNHGQLKKLLPTINDPQNEGFAIVVKKGNNQLAAKLNKALTEIMQEKDVGNMYLPYIGRRK